MAPTLWSEIRRPRGVSIPCFLCIYMMIFHLYILYSKLHDIFRQTIKISVTFAHALNEKHLQFLTRLAVVSISKEV